MTSFRTTWMLSYIKNHTLFYGHENVAEALQTVPPSLGDIPPLHGLQHPFQTPQPRKPMSSVTLPAPSFPASCPTGLPLALCPEHSGPGFLHQTVTPLAFAHLCTEESFPLKPSGMRTNGDAMSSRDPLPSGSSGVTSVMITSYSALRVIKHT